MVTHVASNGALEVIAGIDLKSYERLSGPFHYLEGGPFQGPNDVLVDDLFAKSKHVNVGDTIEVLNNNFRVAGIVEQGKGARKFLQIGVLQDLIGAKDKASIFYLKLDDPNNADAVVDEIKNVPGMEKYVATSMAYYLSMMTPSNYPGLVDVYRCGDRHFRDHRVHCHLPGDVYGGDGAHARDWNPEVDGRVEVLYCECDFAGDGAAGDRRASWWGLSSVWRRGLGSFIGCRRCRWW